MSGRKGPSPQKLKMDAYRRRPYTDTQRMNYAPCECDPKATIPPPWVRDLAADRALSGGYRLRLKGPKGSGGVSNICPRCYQARSVNRACGC